VLTSLPKVRQLTIRLALLGLLITAAIYISIAYTPYTNTPNAAETLGGAMVVILCPPSLLAIPLFDIEPYSMPGAVLWSFIGLLNMGLYAVVGAVVGRFLWRKGRVA
jgi:hypothetical protein